MWGERMSKMRIYEYAREKNVSSKKVIDELLKMDIEVASHMSSINLEQQLKLDDIFNGKESEKKETKVSSPKERLKQQEQVKKHAKTKDTKKKAEVKKERKQPHKKNKGKKNYAENRVDKKAVETTEEAPTHLVYSGVLTVD